VALTAELDAQFAALYASVRHHGPLDVDAFRAAAFEYFDQRHAVDKNVDPFFGNFGPIGLPFPATELQQLAIWEWALDLVHAWEATTGHLVHKGTGYYFAGVRDIAVGDLDRGFLYMHQAAAEDARSTGLELPPRPAVWFITLDGRRVEQAYREKVLEYEAHLRRRLRNYRRYRAGSLTLTSLRGRANRHPELLDAVTTIAHVVARLSRLNRQTTRRIRQTEFAVLLLSQVSLELCLVIEELLAGVFGRGETFKPLAAAYAPTAGMSLTDVELGQLNQGFIAAFDTTLLALLAGRRVPGFGRSLSPAEADLVIAYGIRNRSAHGLERPEVGASRFDRIMSRLFFALFKALESMYA
jgi:hypothetical protein